MINISSPIVGNLNSLLLEVVDRPLEKLSSTVSGRGTFFEMKNVWDSIFAWCVLDAEVLEKSAESRKILSEILVETDRSGFLDYWFDYVDQLTRVNLTWKQAQADLLKCRSRHGENLHAIEAELSQYSEWNDLPTFHRSDPCDFLVYSKHLPSFIDNDLVSGNGKSTNGQAKLAAWIINHPRLSHYLMGKALVASGQELGIIKNSENIRWPKLVAAQQLTSLMEAKSLEEAKRLLPWHNIYQAINFIVANLPDGSTKVVN